MHIAMGTLSSSHGERCIQHRGDYIYLSEIDAYSNGKTKFIQWRAVHIALKRLHLSLKDWSIYIALRRPSSFHEEWCIQHQEDYIYFLKIDAYSIRKTKIIPQRLVHIILERLSPSHGERCMQYYGDQVHPLKINVYSTGEIKFIS